MYLHPVDKTPFLPNFSCRNEISVPVPKGGNSEALFATAWRSLSSHEEVAALLRLSDLFSAFTPGVFLEYAVLDPRIEESFGDREIYLCERCVMSQRLVLLSERTIYILGDDGSTTEWCVELLSIGAVFTEDSPVGPTAHRIRVGEHELLLSLPKVCRFVELLKAFCPRETRFLLGKGTDVTSRCNTPLGLKTQFRHAPKKEPFQLDPANTEATAIPTWISRFSFVESVPLCGGLFHTNVTLQVQQRVSEPHHVVLYESASDSGVKVRKWRSVRYQKDIDAIVVTEEIHGQCSGWLCSIVQRMCDAAHKRHLASIFLMLKKL